MPECEGFVAENPFPLTKVVTSGYISVSARIGVVCVKTIVSGITASSVIKVIFLHVLREVIIRVLEAHTFWTGQTTIVRARTNSLNGITEFVERCAIPTIVLVALPLINRA